MAVDGVYGVESQTLLQMFDSTTGSPTIDTSVFANGAASLKCTSAATAVYGQWTVAQNTFAGAARFRIGANPTGSTAILAQATGASANFSISVTTAGNLVAQVAGGTQQSAGAFSAAAFHWVTWSFDSSGATYRLMWSLDGAAQTDATATPGGGAANMTAIRVGQTNAATTCTVNVDDIIRATATTDYPIADSRVLAYLATGVGTHVNGANFQDDAGSNLTVDVTTYNRIDEWTPNTTDWVSQNAITGSGTDYAEWTLANTSETNDCTAVTCTAALFASSASGGNVAVKIRDGSSDGTVFATAAVGSTSLVYKKATFASKPSTGAWTNTALNALTARFGYSTSVSTIPKISAFLVEAAFPTASSGSTAKQVDDTMQLTDHVSVGGQVTTAWQMSAVSGGGFQNVVCVDPVNANYMLSGADVAGIHFSSDAGVSWRPVNDFVTSVLDLRIADIKAHPTISGVRYALIGNGVTSGGILFSTDRGQTWVFNTHAVIGAGNNRYELTGPSNDHPRSVGNLIALDTANGYIYAGSYRDGVWRATLNATTGVPGAWTQIGLLPVGAANYYIRSCITDSSGNLYLATYPPTNPNSTVTPISGHVYRSTNPRVASPTFTEITASPLGVEEMVIITGHLYAVTYNPADITQQGLFRWASCATSTAGDGSAWVRKTGVPNTGPQWYSIDGYKSGGTTTLWVGCDNPVVVGANSVFPDIYKGTSASDFSDAGTWTAYPDTTVSHGTSVKNQIGGSGGPAWWLYTGVVGVMLGKGSGTISCIVANSATPNTVLFWGRAGGWKTTDGGTTFYPMVKGMGVTELWPVRPDPANSDHVVTGAGDWTFMRSSDRMQTVVMERPAGQTYGLSVDWDTSTNPSTVYVGVGNAVDNNTGGEVYSNADLFGAGSSWIDTGLSTATVTGARPTGLIVIRNATPATVVIAAVQGQGTETPAGVYRKVGAAAWTKSTSTSPGAGLDLMQNQNSPNAIFAWFKGSSFVFVFDRNSGVWRGSTYGATWTRIWNQVADSDATGFLAAHPTNGSILYASGTNGFYKLTNVTTVGQDGISTAAGNLTQIAASTLTFPGPIETTNSGEIYVAQRGQGTGSAALYKTTTANESILTDVSDSFYRNAAQLPDDMTADSSGFLYQTQYGNGLIMQVNAGGAGNQVFNVADTMHLADTVSLTQVAGVTNVTKRRWTPRSG